VNAAAAWLRRSVTNGAPAYPLLVLFGLNAVDELDRAAFGILLPEIRDAFGLDIQGVLTVVGAIGLVALLLQVPVAYLADRGNRVRIATLGAAAWGVFSLLTGLATGIVALAVYRIGSGLGKAVVDPTHNSLLADYYDIESRARVFSFHRAANALGSFLGPLLAGVLAYSFGWRSPFLLFALPTFVLVLLALRLREPTSGVHERRAAGADEATALTAVEPVSFSEAWRAVWKIECLRRIWWSLPFLSASLIGFVSLAGLLYEQVFDLDERARGFIAAGVEPAQFVGLIIGARVSTRLLADDPGRALRFLAGASVVVAAGLVVFGLAPSIPVAIAGNVVIAVVLSVLGPGILASLSLAIPAHVRAVGFSVGALWIIPGLAVLPMVGWIGDTWGIRQGMLVMVPLYLLGGLILSSAGRVIARDIQQVWTAGAARAEVARDRAAGRAPLLRVRELQVSYGPLRVLTGVDLDVDEGEIVALLGTNGAGKSTLLHAIAGVVEADRGAVVLDGRDITHAPPQEVAAHGVAHVAGGIGTFPSLTVAEHLELAAWLVDDREAAKQRALDAFPSLASRLDAPAGDLSGGQQQMLALGMALAGRPKLLLVDELSLGLAPAIVAELLEVVRDIARAGTTVVVVEQSVQLALTVAETAYFLEKGRIRFHGPTAELLECDDVLRSVFLGHALADDGGGLASRANGSPNGSSGGQATELAPRVRATTGEPQPAAGAAPPLAVEGVSRSFGGVKAVDDVSLTLAPGELLGIIGANGAGKTTLFDLVSGFVPVEHGRVLLGGRDVTRWSPDRRATAGLGRSFQHAELFPALTVDEALAVAMHRWVEAGDPLSSALHLPTVASSEDAVHRRVDELVELFGLGDLRSVFVRELSTGSRRIVELACACALRPRVLLLDEPSTGIAQREAEALAGLLPRVRDHLGAAVILIEHDMAVATAVADRFVAMDAGRVLADGPPGEVLGHPAVIAAYLGTDAAASTRSAPVGAASEGA
jgi:ABC-type branched-subunit amino acid transport system ATPase component/sugar phosphate permease